MTTSYHRFPFSWYFSWTSGAPHHSGFKFHIVALSLLRNLPSTAVIESVEMLSSYCLQMFCCYYCCCSEYSVSLHSCFWISRVLPALRVLTFFINGIC
jgi:hypothetical protein